MRETTRGRWTSGTLVLLCALLSSGCSLIGHGCGDMANAPCRPGQGTEGVCHYPPSWCALARENRPAGMLARDGDFFWIPEARILPFFIERPTGHPWSWRTKDDVLLLNGKAVSVRPHRKRDGSGCARPRSRTWPAFAFSISRKSSDALDFGLLEKLAGCGRTLGSSEGY